MRALLVLPMLLLASQPAQSVPPFPLDFDGETCDTYSGVCTPVAYRLYMDGSIEERNTGVSGTYTWNGSIKKFRANFTDLLSTSLVGYKDDGAPCVSGDYATIIPTVYGTFWFCKV